jgi:hypothetical protein
MRMPNFVSFRRNPPVAQLVGIVMLAWALVPFNPYAYYVLLRWIVCGILVFLAVRAHELEMTNWVWILGITAGIYNPIVRTHLDREIWSLVNLTTIGLLVATISVLKKMDS